MKDYSELGLNSRFQAINGIAARDREYKSSIEFDNQVEAVRGIKLSRGVFRQTLDIGFGGASTYVRLDGQNNRIIVNDGTNNRVVIGSI